MAEVVRNPAHTVRRNTSGGSPLEFHRHLPGYRPTRLISLPGIAADLGAAHLLVKAEVGRFGLPAFKILGASYALHRALDRCPGTARWSGDDGWDGWRRALAGRGPHTLVTATDGNHGRAVAHLARRLGLAAHVIVPTGTSTPRIDAIRSEGAVVEVVEGDYDAAVAAAAALASDGVLVVSDTAWEGYHEIPDDVVDGYRTIFDEIDEQMAASDLEPTHVVVPTGVGALAAAAVRWSRRQARRSVRVVVVEPVSAACITASIVAGRPVVVGGPHPSSMAGLNCGTPSPVAWPDLATGVAWCITIHDADTVAAMAVLESGGVEAGESGAASLGGLLGAACTAHAGEGAATALIEELRDGVVVCLVTEGATDPMARDRALASARTAIG